MTGNRESRDLIGGVGRVCWKEAALFFLAGLVVRIGYLAAVAVRFGTTQYSDALYLHQLAVSISKGLGFTIDGHRIFNQSMGYPFFISLFYRVFGDGVWVAFAVNAALGALSVGLVYLLALRLMEFVHGNHLETRGKAVARTTAVLAVFYPDSLLYGPIICSENLLVPLMLLLLLATLGHWRCDWTAGVVVGMLAAAAATTKAHVMVLCLFLPLLWWGSRQGVVRRTAAAAIAGIVCLAPGTYLNYQASGYVMPFAAVAGTVFLDGTNPSAVGKPTDQYHLSPGEEAGKNEIELNALRLRKGLSYARARPAWFVKLVIRKIAYGLSPARDFMFEFAGQPRLFSTFLSRWGVTAFNALLLIGTGVGLFRVRHYPTMLSFGLVLAGSAILLQAVFFGYSRYRYPFLFCLLPFVALSFTRLLSSVLRG